MSPEEMAEYIGEEKAVTFQDGDYAFQWVWATVTAVGPTGFCDLIVHHPKAGDIEQLGCHYGEGEGLWLTVADRSAAKDEKVKRSAEMAAEPDIPVGLEGPELCVAYCYQYSGALDDDDGPDEADYYAYGIAAGALAGVGQP